MESYSTYELSYHFAKAGPKDTHTHTHTYIHSCALSHTHHTHAGEGAEAGRRQN